MKCVEGITEAWQRGTSVSEAMLAACAGKQPACAFFGPVPTLQRGEHCHMHGS